MADAALLYLAALNALTFVIYGVDKLRAKNGKWRIAEHSLLLLALAGGSIGALLAVRLFRHKTMHNAFRYGIPAMLIVQMVLACLVCYLRYCK